MLALRMALRELRGGLSGLRLLAVCLVLGVAALAGVGSLSDAITTGISDRGQLILGGDIEIAMTQRSATAAERKRGISFHRAAGDYAAKKNMRYALEALNRFESYFFNTMAQLSDYLDEVDHPAIKAMYDTFHANIEEKDPVAAIKSIKKHLIHVHVSENDRGTPGKGHVPWDATYKALRAAKYDGWITIEAFSRALPALAAATRVWRDFFPSRESVYLDGIKQMKSGWAKAR